MKTIKFLIKGKPTPKQSTRFRTMVKTESGKRFFFAHPDKKVEAAKDNMRAQIIQQLPADWEPMDGPLKLYVTFQFPYLKGFLKKDSSVKSTYVGWDYIFKPSKPDLDNLLKAIKDAMQSIIYQNDSQIAMVEAAKIYVNDMPVTTITISELPEGG